MFACSKNTAVKTKKNRARPLPEHAPWHNLVAQEVTLQETVMMVMKVLLRRLPPLLPPTRSLLGL